MKPVRKHALDHAQKSPPAWGRGLKPWLIEVTDLHEVAPRVGAWIETSRGWR